MNELQHCLQSSPRLCQVCSKHNILCGLKLNNCPFSGSLQQFTKQILSRSYNLDQRNILRCTIRRYSCYVYYASAMRTMQVRGLVYREMLQLPEIQTTVQYCTGQCLLFGWTLIWSNVISRQFLSQLLASGPLKLDLGLAVSKNPNRPNVLTRPLHNYQTQDSRSCSKNFIK